MATASQSTVARATVDNADGLWRPGSAVKARITVEQQPVELMVPLSALQTMNGEEVVFVRVGEVYQAQPVEVGQRDGQRVEILSGRSEEHTSELQSLMRISYAVFCLKKKKHTL